MPVGLLFSRFQAIFKFFYFFSISLVFMVRFSKFFHLQISKLNFPSIKDNNHDGPTAFLQVLGYFYIFHIFLHIFGVYGPIFKTFSVLDIKIKYSVVLRKQTQQSDCLLAGFWLFLYVLYVSPFLWCPIFKLFFEYQNQNNFSQCYEHLLCRHCTK